jgi:periplasmic protein CpxP/Spy
MQGDQLADVALVFNYQYSSYRAAEIVVTVFSQMRHGRATDGPSNQQTAVDRKSTQIGADGRRPGGDMTLKNSKKAIVAGVLAVGTAAVLVTASVWARQARGEEGRRPGFGRMHRPFGGGFDGLALRELDLTDAQREKIRSIRDQNREAARAIGEKLMAARRGLQETARAETVDESAIRAAAGALANAEAEAAISRARVHAQVWKVLTPEQQEKAKAFRERRGRR